MPEPVIVVYKQDGVDKITSVSSIFDDPITTLENNSIYRKLAKALRSRVVNLSTASDIELGYILSTMPNFTHGITDARVVSGEQWERKLLESFDKSRTNHE